MTINKAQGQTLGRVGVCLDSPCFSHGQLYVAASRVGHPDNIKFAVVPNKDGAFYTTNIVYAEALTACPSKSTHSAASGYDWGSFDINSGEHRSPNNEDGRCCLPRPTCVPTDVYCSLSKESIMMNDVVCEGLEWVRYEAAREKLRLELGPEYHTAIEEMPPFGVIMNA